MSENAETRTPQRHLYLIWLIEDCKQALVFRLGGIFKVFNVLRNHFAICDQEALECHK